MGDDRQENDPPLVRESLDELKVDRLGGDDRGGGKAMEGKGAPGWIKKTMETATCDSQLLN
jgi:hypothetical protein